MNVVRAGATFLTAMFLARQLGASDYGDLAFLLGSFIALRGLLEVGSANAFGSFISRAPEPRQHFLAYGVWLLAQLLFMAFLLVVVLPDSALERLWPGVDRDLTLLALVAVFMSDQIKKAAIQIGESFRRTGFIQATAVAQTVLHLGILVVWSAFGSLSVALVLKLLIVEFLVFSLFVAPFFAKWTREAHQEWKRQREAPFELLGLIRRYWSYCLPLIPVAYFGSIRVFGDRWLLQNYSGSVEQSYFGVAEQYAAVGLLLTSSVLKVLWKEFAEGHALGRGPQMKKLYEGTCFILMLFAALLAGIAVPWAEDVLTLIVGPDFVPGAPIFAVMLLFPIFQSFQQIGSTLLLSTGYTWPSLWLSAIPLIGLGLTYWLVAPHSAPVPGLALGALGLGSKTLLSAIVAANLEIYWISKIFGWRLRFVGTQFWVIGLALLMGLVARSVVLFTFGAPTSILGLLGELVASGCITLLLMTLGMAGMLRWVRADAWEILVEYKHALLASNPGTSPASGAINESSTAST